MLITKGVKGAQDVLPCAVHKNQFIESSMLDIAKKFGYTEIRVPVFEHTELFQRGVGGTTDIVQKEMYTFNDKGGRSVTLRPEGTAGAVRAFLEHGLFNEPLPQKLCYIISCYRYEKPQAGRLREFHQFGAECLGTDSPAADAEVISLVCAVFDFLDVQNLDLQINSIGCPECRKTYHAALLAYFDVKKDGLCPTCLDRLGRNPMRLLDCKSPVCSEIAKDAPVILDYICGECAEHFGGVKRYLDAMGIEYNINPKIVRGLDYYTRTVFEFISGEIGAQDAVCAGGRYDGLAQELGGQRTPSLGFALGLERLLLLMDAQKTPFPEPDRCDIYIAPVGDEASLAAARIVNDLRLSGVAAQFDLAGRSVKAQMKYADKLGAVYTAVLGDSELEKGVLPVKNMDSGDVTEIKLEDFAEDFMDMSVRSSADMFKELLNTVDIDINTILGGALS
ncbi:MAG: histidine--tRNA ligase [Oscillospiraceae bacterium]|nr:histidine--tRNA ligase [Oscillospiraceae bacterium]